MVDRAETEMVDRAETVWKQKIGIEKQGEWGEVEVSTSDTITLGFDTKQDLLFACLVYKSDGTEMNVANAGITISKNVITVVKAALTNIDCTYKAWGYKA